MTEVCWLFAAIYDEIIRTSKGPVMMNMDQVCSCLNIYFEYSVLVNNIYP